MTRRKMYLYGQYRHTLAFNNAFDLQLVEYRDVGPMGM